MGCGWWEVAKGQEAVAEKGQDIEGDQHQSEVLLAVADCGCLENN